MTGIARARLASIDMVRVVGITAVVAGHTWTGEGVALLVYPWHVPLFFFVSGYLWKRKPASADLRARALSLLLPYASWLAVIGVVFFGALAFRDREIPWNFVARALLGGDYIGRPFSAFWFVTALFIAALLYRALDPLPLWAKWAAAAGTLVTAYFAHDTLLLAPLGAGLALPCIVFLVAGESFARLRSQLHLDFRIGLVALFIAAFLVFSRLSAPLNLKQADFGTPAISTVTAILISAGLILVAEPAARQLSSRWSTAISIAAQAGLVVVLTHAVVLWVFRADGDGPVWVFILALLPPWILSVALLYTPLARLLTGQKRLVRAGTN